MGQFTIWPQTGLVKCEIVAGQNEGADTTIPVTGMLQTDAIIAVYMLSAAYVIGECRQPEDFSPALNAANITVVAHARDTTGLFYLIFWQDLT